MIEQRVDVTTPHGSMPTFVFHPEEGGPFPLVLFLMDAPSVRQALRDMASRIASVGYTVMLPYLYYADEPYREFGVSDEEMHRRTELREKLTKARIASDAAALFAHAAKEPVKPGKAGVVGYCMSGPFALAVANAFPDRIAAAASFHGAWFVTDKPDSSHLNVSNVKAEVYLGWADNDPTAPPSDREAMEAALTKAGVRHRIELYPGALHGFAPPGGARYDRAASERHFERLFALFARNLG
ncbi:MAG TPA: dienelactone hydrolase family protein [Polyangiaceae bacterium]|nr:dienelactone hydrolase family protein [Polyangiaceae bacterium]